MRLAMQIPLYHWDDFYSMTDFDFALTHLVNEDETYRRLYARTRCPQRELWLDNSYYELKHSDTLENICKAIEAIEPTHVSCMEEKDPSDNLKAVVRSVNEFRRLGYNIKTIGCWRGSKKELDILLDVCDVVALPCNLFRKKVFEFYSPERFHFFGFKSLDEIITYTPESLDTSTPIRCATQGISLLQRERKPSNMPDFDFYLRLNTTQLKMAIANVQYIIEGGKYANRQQKSNTRNDASQHEYTSESILQRGLD